jgi:hypothetical protein
MDNRLASVSRPVGQAFQPDLFGTQESSVVGFVQSRGVPPRFFRADTARLGLARWLAAAALLVPLLGCGQSGPRLVPVTGLVTLDGTPVAGAGVMFKPAGAGNLPPASATTDAEGKFSLATLNQPGAALGEYQVSVVKQETSGVGEFGAVAPGGPKIKWIVPQKYAMPEKSTLKAAVTEKDREFKFELSSK